MTDTWSIPGPAFLAVYVVLLVLAWVAGSFVIRSVDRRGAGGGPAPDATVEDLALLADGRDRVVQAAIARLLDAGVLRVSHDRRLAATGRPPVGALDEDVVYAVETLSAPTPWSVVRRVKDSAAVRDLITAAQRRGLLHDPAAVRNRKTIAILLFGAVVVLGLARVAAGIARGAPVTYLVILVVIAVILLFARLGTSTHRPTRRGGATLAAARTTSLAAAGAPSAGVARGPVLAGALGVAGIVALGGFAMYPDDEVAGLLAAPSGGGGGGGDGGSSCGSSSCGGGGGGCGGGGCGG